MTEDIRNIPSKVNLEQFDISSFAKDKIREMFRTGKVPTAEAMVDEIILRAVKEGATDVHIEPAESELRIRYGSEGIMKKLVSLPKEISENLGNILKTKANLNAFEKKPSQEGRFSTTVGLSPFDIRVSTIPIMNGERLALRILQKSDRALKIEEFGFSAENLSKVRSLIRRPSGLFLVTGSSGSGKTSTAYAILNEIQSVEKNIFTVEDRIELRLEFASQVLISSDKTFTFADALRSVLRQNSSIILLGDIRDADAGIAAAEAAMTGNFVISTMLSGDAIGVIFQLDNLGVPPFWLASTLIGVAHQKLVRMICASCKEEYQPTEEQLKPLVKSFPPKTKFFHGKGCEACKGSGYMGRTAFHEILSINDELKDLIFQRASLLKLKEAAHTSGFEDIREDAIKKVAAGITTIEEITRAFG